MFLPPITPGYPVNSVQTTRLGDNPTPADQISSERTPEQDQLSENPTCSNAQEVLITLQATLQKLQQATLAKLNAYDTLIQKINMQLAECEKKKAEVDFLLKVENDVEYLFERLSISRNEGVIKDDDEDLLKFKETKDERQEILAPLYKLESVENLLQKELASVKSDRIDLLEELKLIDQQLVIQEQL